MDGPEIFAVQIKTGQKSGPMRDPQGRSQKNGRGHEPRQAFAELIYDRHGLEAAKWREIRAE